MTVVQTPVIKLAQPGYDAKTTGDENLIFSSKWPLLKIYQQGSFTIADVTQTTTIATHDLGFAPMFWWFSNQDITAWENGFNISYPSANRSEFFGPTGGGTVSVSNTKLQWNPTAFTATGSFTGYYYIFAIDIGTQFTAPINRVGGGPAVNSLKFKMKLAKPTFNTKDATLKDYVIHSDCRSPLVHSINPGTVNTALGGGIFGFTVTHNLSYLPMFFGYSLSGGFYTLLATGSGGSAVFSADTSTVQYKEGASGRTMTIVILKDPFTLSYSRAVTV